MVELSDFRDSGCLATSSLAAGQLHWRGTSGIGFLLRQACEKALKSWSHSRGGLAPFTHDLGALMDWLEKSGIDGNRFVPIADHNVFALQTHYDDSLESLSPDWPHLLGITTSLVIEVQRRLS